MKKTNEVEVFDTTLRDGSQSPDVNFSIRDKLDIVKVLDELGVDYIELGWPGSNPKDMECFLEVSKLKLKNSKIVAFGSTRRKGIKAKDDPNLAAIVASKAKVACIFGKSWLQHVKKQLKVDKQENLKAIDDSIRFLKKKGLQVIYDLEHFFDGYKDDKGYALECLKVASRAGVDTLVLCDTNGGCLPSEVMDIVRGVFEFMKKDRINAKLGVHMHNDSGCGVANTLIGVEIGARHVQGTINGIGERTGNADLCSVLPDLALKKGIRLRKIRLEKLSNVSNKVYVLANLKPNSHQPYVGKNAFAHKGGIHVDAVMKGASYEHITPKMVGNERGIVLSELSGKANIVEVAKKFGYKLSKKDPKVGEMLKRVELLEKKGYDIGDLEAEQFLLMERFLGKGKESFKINTWKVSSEQRNGEFSECVVTGTVDGKEREVVAPVRGGPVDAIFESLQKMIATNHKDIKNVQLINYKVMIAEEAGAESSVRVYIEFKSNGDEWGTAGVSTNILEASMEAIEKGFRYYLLKGL